MAYLGKVVHNLMTVLQRKSTLVFEPPGGIYANRKVFAIVFSLGEGLDIFEVSDCPSQQICGHDRGPIEGDVLEALLLALLDVLLRHVAERHLIFRYFQRNIEGGLEIWLIEARESSASIARLELSTEHIVELIVLSDRLGNIALWLIFRAVEACHHLKSQ